MDDETDGRYQTASVQLGWLAFRGTRPRGVPTFAQLGLSELADECREWQHIRSSGDLWEFHSLKAGRPDSWREVAQLMGSVGESVMLAVGAEVEVELLRRAMRDGRLDHRCALAQRFFAEGQAHLLLGAAHRIGNIVLRALMWAPGYPWSAASGSIPGEPVVPYSDDRRDWIPFSVTPRLQRVAAASGFSSLSELTNITVELGSSGAWKAMETQRDLDFHGGREESPVAVGTRRTPAWKQTGPGERTLSGVWVPDLGPEETVAWVENICEVPRKLLDELGPFMARFRDALDEVVAEVAK